MLHTPGNRTITNLHYRGQNLTEVLYRGNQLFTVASPITINYLRTSIPTHTGDSGTQNISFQITLNGSCEATLREVLEDNSIQVVNSWNVVDDGSGSAFTQAAQVRNQNQTFVLECRNAAGVVSAHVVSTYVLAGSITTLSSTFGSQSHSGATVFIGVNINWAFEGHTVNRDASFPVGNVADATITTTHGTQHLIRNFRRSRNNQYSGTLRLTYALRATSYSTPVVMRIRVNNQVVTRQLNLTIPGQGS